MYIVVDITAMAFLLVNKWTDRQLHLPSRLVIKLT